MSGLLHPGAHRAAGLLDDAALLAAMVRVEVAWLQGLAGAGLLSADRVPDQPRVVGLDPAAVEAAGNPVPALVAALRAATSDPVVRELWHRGLTSQDTLDSALVLLARDAVDAVRTSLGQVADGLAELAARHRGSVQAGRTLTQHAVPVTFGLTAAQWLTAVLDADDALTAVRAGLVVSCGGAAGTLSLVAELVDDPQVLVDGLADRLALAAPAAPWHSRRTPVTRIGDALVEVCDALGRLAGDVLLLGRPEVDEVRELPPPGAGGSSTMPHKRNPVLSVLVRSAALQAPGLGAQLHLCAATTTDQRADGGWHAEWPVLHRLLTITVVAAAQTADLLPRLRVEAETMRRRTEAAAGDLLAERPTGRPGGPDDYLGLAGTFVDAAVARHATRTTHPGGPA